MANAIFVEGPLGGKYGHVQPRYGPRNPNGDWKCHLFTRGGVDHYYYCLPGEGWKALQKWKHYRTIRFTKRAKQRPGEKLDIQILGPEPEGFSLEG